MYLLDTNVCSEYLRGRAPITAKVRGHFSDCALSTVTAAELLVWGHRAKSSPRWLPAIENLLAGIEIHDVTLDISRTYGRIRAELLDRGRPLPTGDLFIAATAVLLGLTLVTHNLQDFTDVPGIQLEDWQSP